MTTKNDSLNQADWSQPGMMPKVLARWTYLPEQSDWPKLMTQYCSLGCTSLVTPTSGVTGMVYQMQTAMLHTTLPAYVNEFYDRRRQLPTGIHTIPRSGGATFEYKFPDDPIVLCKSRRWGLEVFTGAASWLDQDWYMHGNTVLSHRPDEDMEIVLRAPIRTDGDGISVARSMLELLRSLPRSFIGEPSETNYLQKTMNIEGTVEKTVSSFHRSNGIPPNLAALYRWSECPEHLIWATETYAKWAPLWVVMHSEENLRIRAYLNHAAEFELEN